MTNDKRRVYIARDQILNLLSESELRKVSMAEGAPRPAEGHEFLDLGALEVGVQRAAQATTPIGRMLPRSAVQEATWTKILAVLAV